MRIYQAMYKCPACGLISHLTLEQLPDDYEYAGDTCCAVGRRNILRIHLVLQHELSPMGSVRRALEDGDQ
jgi:hypothetical protein